MLINLPQKGLLQLKYSFAFTRRLLYYWLFWCCPQIAGYLDGDLEEIDVAGGGNDDHAHHLNAAVSFICIYRIV